jgi:hypothetical protein
MPGVIASSTTWMTWSDALNVRASARPYSSAVSEGALKSVATRTVLSAIIVNLAAIRVEHAMCQRIRTMAGAIQAGFR